MDHNDPWSPHNFSCKKEMPRPKKGISVPIHHVGKIPHAKKALEKEMVPCYVLRLSDQSKRFLPRSHRLSRRLPTCFD